MALFAGTIRSLLGTAGTEADTKSVSVDRFGNLSVLPIGLHQAGALKGARYTAMATPAIGGTGVVLGSYPTAYSDTLKIAVGVFNGDSDKRYAMDYLRGRVIVADTNGTSVGARAEVDAKARYSSGGTALTVGNVYPGASQPTSNATVYVGDVTCSAAGTYRTHVGHQLFKKRAAPNLTVDDTYLFTFGAGMGGGIPTGVANQLITTLTTQVVPFPAAIVPPGGSFLFQLAIVAGDTTPAQLSWEVGWLEL